MNALAKRSRDKLWERGNLSWKLHAAQKALEETYRVVKAQLFVGNCSRQWGKSFWAVKIAVETAIQNPKAQIQYGAAFQTDLVGFIIPAFDKILEDAPKSIKGKKVGHYYLFPNGSRIKLVGLDKNPNGLRGNTLDLIIIDECGFVGILDYIYKSIIVPATLHRPNCKIILISTPPSTPAHAFVDYVQKAELENAYVKLDIFTNPLIEPEYILRAMRETGCQVPADEVALEVINEIIDTGAVCFPEPWVISTTFRREFLCEFVTDSDLQIIPEWNDKYIEVVERDQYYQYYHKYVGMDLGVKDLTAGLFGYFDFKRQSLIVEDEIEMNGPQMNSLVLVGALRAKEKELWDNVDESGTEKRDANNRPVPFRRIADSNWPLFIADLSSLHSLTFIATDKDLLEAMISEVRVMVNYGQILINPKCKKLIGCLKYGVWVEKKIGATKTIGKTFARSSVYGHFDHLAALVYLVRNLVKNTNPIPAGHGFENHTAWLGNIRHKEQSTHNAREIAKILIPKPAPFQTSNRKRVIGGRRQKL